MINQSDLQTGDLLLFKGSHWYSRIIELFGCSPYSHVAIVLRDPIYIRKNLIGLYVLQSNIASVIDIDGQLKDGVQINRLQDIIDEYDVGCIDVRQLTVQRDDNFNQSLKTIYSEHQRDSYDLDFIDWAEALFLIDTNINLTNRIFNQYHTQRTHAFWCSALIAFVYRRLDLLENPAKVPWTLISPYEWSSAGGSIMHLQNCALGPETELIY